MTDFYSWSTTAADNADSDEAINWAENQTPSSVNDSARALMARVATWRNDLAPKRTSSGTGNAYVVLSDAGGSGTYRDGEIVTFVVDRANTGAATLNVNGRGAKPFRPAVGVEFSADELLQDQPVMAFYRSSTEEWLAVNTGYHVTAMTAGALTQSVAARLIQIGTPVLSIAPSAPAGYIRLTEATQTLQKSAWPELSDWLADLSTPYPWGSTSTTFNLPPAAGYFLRFAGTSSSIDPDGSRTAGSTQTDLVKAHTHTVSATGTTSSNGAHSHTYLAAVSGFAGSGSGAVTTSSSQSTSTDGAHTHTVTVSGTAAANTGTENRPKNVAMHVDIFASSTLAAGTLGMFGFPYTWDTGTTLADPGTARVRADTADPADATTLIISSTDAWGMDISTLIAAIATGATLRLSKIGAQNNAIVYSATGTPTDNGTYLTIPVDTQATNGAFAASDTISFEFWSSASSTGGGGTGDVSASSNFGNDNRVIRSDGAGKGVQSTGISVSDSDVVTGWKFQNTGTGSTARDVTAKLSDVIHPKDFGAVGDNSTDDGAAINAAIDHAVTLTNGTGQGIGQIIVDLGGGTYKTTVPITLNGRVSLRNGTIRAAAGSWSSTNGVIQPGGTFATVYNVFIDGDSQAANGFYCTGGGALYSCVVMRCTEAQYLIQSAIDVFDCNAFQWHASQLTTKQQSDRTAIGFDIQYSDVKLTRCNAAYCLYPMRIGGNTLTGTQPGYIQIIGCHTYNGPGGALADGYYAQTEPVNIYIKDARYVQIVGHYLDCGKIVVDKRTGTDVSFIFKESLTLFGAGTTLSNWITLYTEEANSKIRQIDIAGNLWTQSIPIFDFTTGGSGSWDVQADLEAQTQDVHVSYAGHVFTSGTTSDSLVARFLSPHSDRALIRFKSTSTTATNGIEIGADGDDGIIRLASTERWRLGGGGYMEMGEISAPSSPAANKLRIYVKDNGSGTTKLYAKDSAGTETDLFAGSGGSGLANIVEDTTPQLGGMLDANGFAIGDGTLEILKFGETASAVNEITITNAATGNAPTIAATGDDSNIPLNISSKGTSGLRFQIGGTNEATLNSTNFSPGTNDGNALGVSGTAWADLFLADGGVINWNAGNATLTHSTGLLTSNVPLSLGTSNALTAGTVELGHASDTTLSRSAAGELAVEGTIVKKVGKETIWIPAAAMTARTTNGAASGTVETTTNKNMLNTYDFDTSTQEHVQFRIAMPKSWNNGTVTFQPVWSHASTTTNFGVVWQLAAVAISDDDAMDVAFGTAQTSTDTGGTTDDLYIGPESSAITIAGTPTTGDTVQFQLSRVPADGSDTLAVDARLHGIKVYFTTSASTDA